MKKTRKKPTQEQSLKQLERLLYFFLFYLVLVMCLSRDSDGGFWLRSALSFIVLAVALYFTRLKINRIKLARKQQEEQPKQTE